MSKGSQDKRRPRAKEKKLAHRRKVGQSPLSRLAGTDGDSECWVHYSEEDDRMRSYTVFRTVSGGGDVGAFFLIDYDCIGLKDAFVQLNINAAEVREQLRAAGGEHGVRLVRISVDDVRKEVAAAIQWTRTHPFLLPVEWERTLKVIGALDLEHADMSDFGTEGGGGLLYVGRQIDLERRLKGISLEDFLAQPGIEHEFHRGDETFRAEAFDEEWDEHDPARPISEKELDDMFEAEVDFHEMGNTLRRTMLEGVRKWCMAKAQPMEPAMDKAIDVMLTAALQGTNEEDLEAMEAAEERPAAEGALRAQAQLMELESPEERTAISRAHEQLGNYIESLGGPGALMAAMGFGGEKLE